MRRVCVYCGSSPGADPAFLTQATELGAKLAAHSIGLVYGGGHVGLMGAVADAVLAGGGEVVGVIPEVLVRAEVGHRGLTELHVVESMHERKALMAELADGFLALPGGLGTFEELFEVLTWAQLGFHADPVVVLDVADFYAPLFALLDRAVEQRFLRPDARNLCRRATNVDDALALLAKRSVPVAPKWLDRS